MICGVFSIVNQDQLLKMNLISVQRVYLSRVPESLTSQRNAEQETTKKKMENRERQVCNKNELLQSLKYRFILILTFIYSTQAHSYNRNRANRKSIILGFLYACNIAGQGKSESHPNRRGLKDTLIVHIGTVWYNSSTVIQYFDHLSVIQIKY